MAKTVRFHQIGGPEILKIEEGPSWEPGKGEAKLRVQAIGLNRAESMFMHGYYLEPTQLPASLGYEAAGVVVGVGAGVDCGWLNKGVSTIPSFSLNQYGVIGNEMIVPVQALAEYPEHLKPTEATSIWMQYMTAYGALIEIGRLKKGEFVLITAASSSVGLAAIDTVKFEGAIPIATTRKSDKRSGLLASGAEHVIVTDEEDIVSRVHEITNGAGARIILDPIGGSLPDQLAETAAPGATTFQYGWLSGEPTPFPMILWLQIPKRLLRLSLQRSLSPATQKPTVFARRLNICRGLAMVALSLWLAGCNKQQPVAQGPPAPEVTVSKPEQKEVVNWNEFTGRTAAVKLVNVTPRVSGYIVDIPFKEGDIVHKGDLLFQIDPRPYQDAYEQAVGLLQQAQSNQQLQDATFARQQRLRETGVIAKEDYDTALSNKNQAAAQVASAQAARNSAQLNLEFTHVTSPIDGRVSRQLVNIGNLVQADSTHLTTIVSIDPIYAYFSMDELAALSYQRLIREGKVASSQDGKVHVYLQLQDETGFPREGTVDFSDNSFDSSTGTLLVRGSFPNGDGFLTPGNFVRVRVASGPKYDALLVADRAVGSDQDQSFVYVVDSKNITRLRHIKTGQLAEGLRVVKSGLQPDDVVVINGIIKVRPDSPVRPQQGAMEQFSSNDISMPLISSQSSASHAGTERNKATP